LNRDSQIDEESYFCQRIGGDVFYYSYLDSGAYHLDSSICVAEWENPVIIFSKNKNCGLEQIFESVSDCFPNGIVESKRLPKITNTINLFPPEPSTKYTTTTTTPSYTYPPDFSFSRDIFTGVKHIPEPIYIGPSKNTNTAPRKTLPNPSDLLKESSTTIDNVPLTTSSAKSIPTINSSGTKIVGDSLPLTIPESKRLSIYANKLNEARNEKIEVNSNSCKELGGNVLYYNFYTHLSDLNSCLCVKESEDSIMILSSESSLESFDILKLDKLLN